jgi:hypothetical protein
MALAPGWQSPCGDCTVWSMATNRTQTDPDALSRTRQEKLSRAGADAAQAWQETRLLGALLFVTGGTEKKWGRFAPDQPVRSTSTVGVQHRR